ncbi:MAG TPA: tRNA (adenosine(37)-N6)-threonylcarbamoyltransferase complex dimerization subunit type 1 TsaB [Actinomycetes bacterium]|nr:tRNA (adenosine(37)-N6)-threonylcarbamoyltransferase complex dimerization subunit type 1 TsaB [Actinomycetes bacterium]
MSRLYLGIETATPTTTVALVNARDERGEDEVVAEHSHSDARRHGEVLPGLIADVLAQAGVTADDVDVVVVGVGPGAYTGLRVGIATAQALGLTLSVPVVGAVTLDAIAFGTQRTDPFVVVTDARRREVFYARYDNYRRRAEDLRVVAQDLLASELRGDLPIIATSDTPVLPAVTPDAVVAVSAADVCALAIDRARHGVEQQPVRPVYLRHPDVTPATSPKSVL